MARAKLPPNGREIILEVAARVFQKGFRATSLDHVAAELGVTRPALYYYFKSKEDLLAAIYERGVGLLMDQATALFKQDMAPEVRLRRLIEVHIRIMLQERPIVRVYFQEKDSLGQAALRSVRAKEIAFTKMMSGAIRDGQAQGIFRPGDPALIVNAILGMLIWVHEWYRPGRHEESDIADAFWQFLAGGIVAKPAPAQRRRVAPKAARRPVAAKRAKPARRGSAGAGERRR